MFRSALAAAVLTAAVVPAADPPVVPWWVPPPTRDAEFVRMLFAIRDGRMGPGEGWFGPAEAVHSWAWLAERHGIPVKGELTRSQFRGPSAMFARLDRDGDGVLRMEDFDWSPGSPYTRQLTAARAWLGKADGDKDGTLSKAEWDELFRKAAAGGDRLAPEDVRRLLQPPPARAGGGGEGMPDRLTLFKGLLSGEIGSAHPGPKAGDPAPDFALPTYDRKRTVRLSDYRGSKPVALVFGSFT